MAGRTIEHAAPTAVVPWTLPPSREIVRAAGRNLDHVGKAFGEKLPGETPEEQEAWLYFERIPQITTLTNGIAGLISQCRFYVGYIDAAGKEHPARDPESGKVVGGFTERVVVAAEDMLARYTDTSGSQSGILFAQAQVWTVAGDGFLIGYWEDSKNKPLSEAEARNTEGAREVFKFVARGALTKKDSGGGYTLTEERRMKPMDLPPGILVRRMMFENPRYPGEGQGWVRSALEVCRDLFFFTLAQRAGAKSNLPADVWVVPSEATPKDPSQIGIGPGDEGALADGDGAEPQADQSFAAKLEHMLGEFVTAAVTEAQSGNGVIPAFLSIEERLVKSFNKLSFARPIDAALKELVDQRIVALAETAPCPPEMLMGLGQTSRWNGKQIGEDEYRRYFRPTTVRMANEWTAGLLYHEMILRKMPAAEFKGLRVLVDARDVVAPPDMRELANDGVRVGAIGPSGWRTMLGVPHEYAPSPEELDLMKALRTNPDSHSNQGTGRGDQGPPSTVKAVDTTKGSGALRASAVPTLAMSLLSIEHAARHRLEEAAEAALDDAIQRTGARLKNWARQAKIGHLLPSPLDSIDCRDLARLLGPKALELVNDRLSGDDDQRREDLFAAALATLLIRFEALVRQGYEQAQRTLGVTVPPEEIEANIVRGQAALRAGMILVADRELFGRGDPPDTEGEQVAGIRVPTNVLRVALAAAGGAAVVISLRPIPANTTWVVADGSVVLDSLVFGPTLAKFQPPSDAAMWVYGDEYRSRQFEPHHALDGAVVASPDDPALAGSPFSAFAGFYSPGDHSGCRCDLVPVPKEA